MKPFEERYTAWIDGQLSESECAAFEAELDDRAAAAADKEAAQKLGSLLRTHGVAPQLTNGDFFNTQLMARLAADERKPERAASGGWRFAWTWPHLAWASVCGMLLAVALSKSLLPSTSHPTVARLSEPVKVEPAEDWTYSAQVVEARPADPSISVTALRSGREGVSVLWLDGLDFLPASYELQ